MQIVIGLVVGLVVAWLFARRKIFLLEDARRGLRDYSERMRDLQEFWHEHTGDPFLLADAGMKVKSMNQAARKLLGVGAEPVAGRPLSAFLGEGCEALAAVRAGLEKGPGLTRRGVLVRPVRTAEANREIILRVVEDGEDREAWILLRLAGG